MKKILARWLSGLVFLPALIGRFGFALGEPAELPAATLAVMNFTDTGKETAGREKSHSFERTQATLKGEYFLAKVETDHGWLGKALADLLIANLSEIHPFTVVERERMQQFLEETELQKTGLFDKQGALRLGRVAKVREVIYGHYEVETNTIQVSAFVVDLGTQEVIGKEQVSGPIGDLRGLVRQLALQFVEHRGIALNERERQAIQYEATDSLSATEHFYRGIDYYDQGLYADAFGEFLGAARQDPNYFEAWLWEGKMFEESGYGDHAVLSFENIYRRCPDQVEGFDALFFAGHLRERRGETEKALEAWRRLGEREPTTPHVLEAWYRWGLLLKREGKLSEAYAQFKKVDGFVARVKAGPEPGITRSPLRKSRFFTWDHALGLYKDSILELIELYGQLPPEQANAVEAPRGVLRVTQDQTAFSDQQFGATPSIFFQGSQNPSHQDHFYAVVASPGTIAVGLDLTVNGRMLIPHPFHGFSIELLPFPIPKNYLPRQLGSLVGQTQKLTTLKKYVSFHGRHRKTFTLRVSVDKAEMKWWAVRVHFRPELAAEKTSEGPAMAKATAGFWEGMPVAILPLPAASGSRAGRSYAESYNRPRQNLALLARRDGSALLVAAVGEWEGAGTDLWAAPSPNGTDWTPLVPLPVNSQSEDFSPKIREAEDGRVWLSWISTRRGRGWELWLSSAGRNLAWSDPHRIPLEKFANHQMEQTGLKPEQLLEYDLLQGTGGQWVLAFYSPGTREVVFLKSMDGREWSLLAIVSSAEPVSGISLLQEAAGEFRLAAWARSGSLYLWKSPDGSRWETAQLPFRMGHRRVNETPQRASIHLFSREEKGLLILAADSRHGPQFAHLVGESREAVFDLVTRAGTDPLAVARLENGDFLAASEDGNSICLRRYRHFNTTGQSIEEDTREFPIYEEKEKDSAGNLWHRYFAQERFRVPDVTAVGVSPDGGIWWGIESGIMYRKGPQFFAADVSQGFFHNTVTNILCADSITWFASRYFDRPMLGMVRTANRTPQQFRFETWPLPGVHGSITALAVGQKPGDRFAGTSQGEVVGFHADQTIFQTVLEGAPEVTALAVEANSGILWAGTSDKGIFGFEGGKTQHFHTANQLPSDRITALAIDTEGRLWAGTLDKGLLCRQAGRWVAFGPENSGVFDASIGAIKPHLSGGIWYIPHREELSKGLGYFDGTRALTYNPAYRILESPSSLDIDKNGHVWVGTWFDGLFELEAGDKKP